jgi:hypothetical protein
MRLTKDQLREAVETIYAALCDDRTDKEIMADMGLTAEEFDKLKTEMFDKKADSIRTKPEEHTYVEYLIQQTGNIQALTDMISEFKSTKQYNAMVGAVKARADIYDKLIAKGQEFGLISKQPERKEIVAGVLVADLSNQQLKTEITRALDGLNQLQKRFGDGDLLALPKAESLHRGPALQNPENETRILVKPTHKKSKVTKSKVRKGRKRKAPPAIIPVGVN